MLLLESYIYVVNEITYTTFTVLNNHSLTCTLVNSLDKCVKKL